MWLICTLLTTTLWGMAELFYKKGAHPNEKYAHIKMAISVGIVMGVHSFIILMTSNINYNPINIIYYMPVSLCYIISMALSFFGMRFIEESISDPIENTSGAITALMCVLFLGKRMELISAIAIILILIGILGVGFLDSHGDTDRSKKLGKKMAVIAFTMPFCYATLDALGSFLDVYYLDTKTTFLVNVTEDTIENVANTSYELTFLIGAIILLIFIKKNNVRFELFKQKDKILAALLETGGQFTYVFAMSQNGTIAAPIISSVCVVSLILSRIFLKEKLTKWQYIFLFLVIIGILTLSVVEGD